MKTDSETHTVRCFFSDKPAANGNPASVTVASPASHDMADVMPDVTRVAVCPASDGCWRVESRTPAGRPIRFCGHGALAAAFVLFDRYTDADRISCNNRMQSWTAYRGGDGFPVRLQYARPEYEAVPVPDAIARWLGAPVIAAARCGDEQGYLILQLEHAGALAVLRPDFTALAALTAHSVIATAPGRAPADVAFRYFAPQYGVDEDAATGSAAVQLASWWVSRGNSSELTLHQQSLSGGWLRVRCNDDTVELSGRVAYG